MRQLLCLITALTICTSSFCDEPKDSKTRYYRHEINVSIGGTHVRSGWSNDYERSVMNQFGLVVGRTGDGKVIYEWKDNPDLGTDNPLKTMSYYYHLDHHFAVGGMFGFCNVQDWLGYPEVYRQGEIQKTGDTDVKGTSLFLMPSVKWSWLNNRWCSLYMKVTAGFHYQSLYLDTETIPKEQTDEFDKSHVGLGYYVTPFGWEIGKQKVRWFMEFGLGSNTNFQMGLTYRFGRY